MHFTISLRAHAIIPRGLDDSGAEVKDYIAVYGSREIELPTLPFPGVSVYLDRGGFISADICRNIEMRENSNDCLIEFFPADFRPGKERSSYDLPRIIGENPDYLASPEWHNTVAQLGEYISPSGWKIRVGPWRVLI